MTLLIKAGGGEGIHLDGIASDLAVLEERAVVVHGANACRDRLGARLGIPQRTITSESGIESVLADDETLEVTTMAYAGLVNKSFVSLCQRRGVDAIGLTGLDGALVRGRRNRGIRVVENGRRRILRDHSGKPVSVNVELLRLLLDAGYTPLVTVPILDEDGSPVTTENDDIVALLQRSLSSETVVQLIEAPGLLEDPGSPDSLIRGLTRDELEEREARATGRYRRKLMALSKMLESGCRRIVVGDGRLPNPLRSALEGQGTVIE